MDLARGVAILAVMLCHCGAYTSIPWVGWTHPFLSASIAGIIQFPSSWGQGGVALFFVISGFCIHLSYQQGNGSWRDFYIRRVFRIYPAFLAALIAGWFVASSPFLSGGGIKQIVTHVLLIHNFWPDTFKGINGAFWSLAVEAQLYLLYPVLLFAVRKFGWRNTLIALAVIELASAQSSGYAGLLPTAYWFSWSLGARIAESFLRGQAMPFLKISPLWPATFAIAGYFFKPLSPFWFTGWAATSAIALSHIFSSPRKPRTPRPVRTALRNIGIWSYSLYLVHLPVQMAFFYGLLRLFPGARDSINAVFLLMLLTWAAIIPLAILWYHCFELPGIAIGKRLLSSNAEPFRFGIKYAARLAAIFTLLMAAFAARACYFNYIKELPETKGHQAWSLATNPDATKRNGPLAVTLALDACGQTHMTNVIMMSTLAAAYAEAGQFTNAISTAQHACRLAAINGQTNLLQMNQELLMLYESHQACREKQSD